MSDRDESVRALAEEIVKSVAYWSTQGSERWDELTFRQSVAAGWERRLTAFLTEREAELQDQLHRALGDGAVLREEGLSIKAVLFVLLRDGRVLMERCPNKAQVLPGEWFIPGGRIEAGETPISALNRELGEELGIVPLRTVEGPLVDTGGNPPIPFLMRLFVVVEWAGEVPEEIIDAPGTLLRWIPIEEARNEARGAIRAILDHAEELVNRIPQPAPEGAER